MHEVDEMTYIILCEWTLKTWLWREMAKEVIALLQVFGSEESQEQHVETAQANSFVDFGPWPEVLRSRVEAELEEVEDGEDRDNGYDADDSACV